MREVLNYKNWGIQEEISPSIYRNKMIIREYLYEYVNNFEFMNEYMDKFMPTSYISI